MASATPARADLRSWRVSSTSAEAFTVLFFRYSKKIATARERTDTVPKKILKPNTPSLVGGAVCTSGGGGTPTALGSGGTPAGRTCLPALADPKEQTCLAASVHQFCQGKREAASLRRWSAPQGRVQGAEPGNPSCLNKKIITLLIFSFFPPCFFLVCLFFFSLRLCLIFQRLYRQRECELGSPKKKRKNVNSFTLFLASGFFIEGPSIPKLKTTSFFIERPSILIFENSQLLH